MALLNYDATEINDIIAHSKPAENQQAYALEPVAYSEELKSILSAGDRLGDVYYEPSAFVKSPLLHGFVVRLQNRNAIVLYLFTM